MSKLPKAVEEVLAGTKIVTVKYLNKRIVYDGEVGGGRTVGYVVDVYDWANGNQRDRTVTWLNEIEDMIYTWSDIQIFSLLVGKKLGAEEDFMAYLAGSYLFTEGLIRKGDSEMCIIESLNPEVANSYRSFSEGEIYLFPLKRMGHVDLRPCQNSLDFECEVVSLKLSNTTKVICDPEKLCTAEEMAIECPGIVVAFICTDAENGYSKFQILGDADNMPIVFNAALDADLCFRVATGQKMPDTIEHHDVSFELPGYDFSNNCRYGIISYCPGAIIDKQKRDFWAEIEYENLFKRVNRWKAENQPLKRKKSKV